MTPRVSSSQPRTAAWWSAARSVQRTPPLHSASSRASACAIDPPFDLSNWPTRVAFGAGRLRDLASLLADAGIRRPLVVCGATVAGGPILPRVEAALAGVSVAIYRGVERNSPGSSVQAAADAARRHAADGFVSVGGGSAIDTAKCAAVWLAAGGETARTRSATTRRAARPAAPCRPTHYRMSRCRRPPDRRAR